MQFTKMHGIGNDYIYVDCFHNPVPDALPELARKMADRHFGVGGDGLILIHPSEVADARMQMFNADGSEAEMCGNGLRCFARYVYDHDIARRKRLSIETGAGVLAADLEIREGQVDQVIVDMGEPILAAERIPTRLPGDPVVDVPLELDGRTFLATCVSMGNPHCVLFVDQITDELVRQFGPRIERDQRFPARVNVEFVEVVSRGELRQRTWERGSGETLACGTGACAVCVAGVLSGRSDRRVRIELLGGGLELHWDESTRHVMMTGPAVEVFTGTWPDPPADSHRQ